MASFGDIYKYISSSGIVIPDTSEVKRGIEDAFKDIFGEDFSVDPETPNGVLIACLAKLFTDVVGVNAQNANGFNLKTALGSYLDGLGQLFGIERGVDESDTQYRLRIIKGQSRGMGFVQSIYQAISQVAGVKLCCVLDNGYEEPAVFPNPDNGIVVSPHSIFVSVLGGDDNEVAKAIFKTKSAGCGYTTDEAYGEVKDIEIEDTSTHVYFYEPAEKEIGVSITVTDVHYTGIDLEADLRAIVKRYFNDNAINCMITADDLSFAISSSGMGIQCKSVSFTLDEQEYSQFPIRPFEYADGDTISANAEIVVING